MRILLVEDDEAIAVVIIEFLKAQNYVVESANDGQAGWDLVEAFTYDLILLDVMLPKLDGMSLCRRLRAKGYQMPVLLLTGRDTSTDKVMGLDVGADDYVVKPFDLKELGARIRALLRRGNSAFAPVLEWGKLHLDPSTCQVNYANQPLNLTPKEYALLELFLRNSRRVFKSSAILDHLWSCEDAPGEDTVKAHIKGLRKKLNSAGAPRDLIETVYGIGYRLKMLSESEEKQSTPQILVAGLPEQLTSWLQQRFRAVSIQVSQSSSETLQALERGNWSLLLLNHSVISQTVAKAISQAYPRLKQAKQSIIYCLEKNLDINLPSKVVGQIVFHPLNWEEVAEVVAETLGLPLPPPPAKDEEREKTASITRLPLASPDSLQLGINAIWGKFKGKILSRVQTIDQAASALIAGNLSDEMLQEAVRESHKLAGSLGTFGFYQGSNIAREIEQLLQQKAPWGEEQLPRLRSLVVALRQELEENSTTPISYPLPATRQQPNSHIAEKRPLRILLAEDNGVNQQVALHLLKQIGYKADVVGNGLKVLEALQQKPYDVVLMDVQMPLMDGLTATKRICSEWSHTSRPRIIAVTASSMQSDKTECLNAGMDDYITKPIRMEELVQVLSKCEPKDCLISVNLESTSNGTSTVNKAIDNTMVFTDQTILTRPEATEATEQLHNSKILSQTPIDKKILESLGNTGGETNYGLVAKLIDCYLEESPKLVQAMKNALLPLDVVQLQRTSHTLKASSASIGATNLANFCKELEAMSRTGTFTNVTDKVLDIVAEYERVKATLQIEYQQKSDSQQIVTYTLEDSPLVLIVDDDNFLRLQLRGMLENQGYRVVEASNGEEGLAACTQYSPDIVLLDGIMPVMDGFTCCQLMRKLPGCSNIPVLIVTSLEDTQSVDMAFEAGANDYITKPIHWAVLRQRVLRMIQASRAEAETLKALEKEKELNDLKSRFISMTSHEFRAPMHTILSSAELIEHFGYRFTEDKKLQHLHRIQSAVKKMTHLLDEVLLIGKAEAGKIDFNPAPFELRGFCHELVENMQLNAGTKHTLHFVSIGDSANGYMDEKIIESIFTNLLSNAIKYSPEGGNIYTKLVCEYNQAIVSIQDEGLGIPEADLVNLFNHFHRASNVGNISGTGLGLAIVKNCVELHGGTILVKSTVGVGTTFIVTLPLNKELL